MWQECPGGPDQSIQIDCATQAVIGESEPSDSNIVLDRTGNTYHFSWKTDKTWQRTCRQLIVKLVDNTTHTAIFTFR